MALSAYVSLRRDRRGSRRASAVAQLSTLGVMPIALSILCFVVSLAAMIFFSIITAQAVKRREISSG